MLRRQKEKDYKLVKMVCDERLMDPTGSRIAWGYRYCNVGIEKDYINSKSNQNASVKMHHGKGTLVEGDNDHSTGKIGSWHGV